MSPLPVIVTGFGAVGGGGLTVAEPELAERERSRVRVVRSAEGDNSSGASECLVQGRRLTSCR
jgi:hypothetical protein